MLTASVALMLILVFFLLDFPPPKSEPPLIELEDDEDDRFLPASTETYTATSASVSVERQATWRELGFRNIRKSAHHKSEVVRGVFRVISLITGGISVKITLASLLNEAV